MKRIFILIYFFSLPLFATNYYVSNDGNDEANGLSEKTAWKTLEKVNKEMNNFEPGDVIAFNRGDVFQGSLKIYSVLGKLSDKIIFTSYGNGEKAIISGQQLVTNWSPYSGNIYETKVQDEVFQVFKGDAFINNTRTPENDVLTIDNVSNQLSFSSNDLIGKQDIVGATIFVYPYVWFINTLKVVGFDSSTGTVTIDKKGVYDISKGNEFFIVNHRNFLIKENSWSYNQSESKLYYYSIGAPQNVSYVASNSNGIQIKNSSNVEVNNLFINKFNENGIHCQSSSNILIENNRIDRVYSNGIYAQNGSGIIIRKNIIENCIKTAINGDSNGIIIEDNRIDSNGLIENVTSKGYSQSYGIEVWKANSQVRNNHISNLGYIGIRFYGPNNVIENNFIENFCLVLNDGGAIYTYNSSYNDPVGAGTKIVNNIIIGSETIDPEYSVFGIYMDDRSHDVEILGNSIANTKVGIFLHNTKRHLVSGNKIYKTIENGIGLLEDTYGGDGEMVDNIIENNEVFILSNEMYNYPLMLRSLYKNYNFGTFDDNKYFNPYNKKNIGVQNTSIYWFNPYQPRSMNLKEWQNFYGQDMNSSENDFYWDSYNVERVIGENLISNEKFDAELNSWSSFDADLSVHKESVDNNCMKVSSKKEDAAAFSNVFEVVNNGQYLLEFDIRSESSLTLKLQLNRINAPYSDIFVRPIWAESSWQHYAIPIDSEFKASDMRLNFYFLDNGGVFYLDNVKINKVELAGSLPERSKFIYNKENLAKDMPINGSWQDLDGKAYKGNIKIPPHSSVILISNDNIVSVVKADAGQDKTMCQGESVVLTASGGSGYTWSTGATTKSITVSPTRTSTYSVTVTEGIESETDDVIVTVNNVTADAGFDQTISEGESVSLTVSGGERYLWSNGEKTETITVSPNITTTYSVSVTKGGCTDTDNVKVTVNASSEGTQFVVNAGQDESICQGESVILTASGGSDFSWSTGESTQSITVSPNTTQTYTVTARDGSGNLDTDDVIVTVNSITANAGSDRTITEGDSVTLTASGGVTYTWNTGDTGSSITISPTSTIDYTVTVTKDGCDDTDSVKVTVTSEIANPPPAEAFAGDDISICLGESVTLNASGGDTFTWSTGDTNPNIDVNPTRTTTYTLSAVRGGTKDTDTVTVSVENCDSEIISNEENLAILEMAVYPNPTKGKLTIQINNLDEHANFIINDTKGSLIYSDYISGKKTQFEKQINLSRYSDGLYFVRLYTAEKYLVKKVVVQ